MTGGKPLGGLVTAIGKNLLGNKFEKYPQPYGKQYQLVQVADDRDEIWNQINWRKSVSNDQNPDFTPIISYLDDLYGKACLRCTEHVT